MRTDGQVDFYPSLTKEIVGKIKVVFLSHCHEDHVAVAEQIQFASVNLYIQEIEGVEVETGPSGHVTRRHLVYL